MEKGHEPSRKSFSSSYGIYFLTFSKIAIENKIWNVFCPVHIFGFVKSVAYIYPNSVSKSGVEVFLHECEIYLLCDMTYFCDIERAYYFWNMCTFTNIKG